MAPGDVAAYKAKHPVGSQIVLPDLNNPGSSIAYLIDDIQVAEVDDHPATGDSVNRVTLVLKN